MVNAYDDSIIILASKSPRRRYLLQQAGLSFRVIPSSIDEASVEVSSPATYVKVLSEAKAHDVAVKYPDKWVIGADTIVLQEGTILGKPRSQTEARAMIKRLSGQTHQVLTGYAICCKAKSRSFSETIKTDVLFKNLTDEEIEWYIHTKEPFDKAGAYAIQGLGAVIVERIEGDYSTVIGLPLSALTEALKEFGINIL